MDNTTQIEAAIRNFIAKNFGESEAEDPCYAIAPMAEAIAKEITPQGDRVSLMAGDILICDPCYIKAVRHAGYERHDAFTTHSLYNGSDGEYRFRAGDEYFDLGCDSGRVWAMRAEFDVELVIDSGFSGYHIATKGTALADCEYC